MTARTSWTIRCFVWGLLPLFGALIVWRAFHPEIIRYKNHTSQIKTVGLALKLYADDHQGVLPTDLQDLVPLYLTRQALEGVQYGVPNAQLSELPPRAVLARRLYPEDHLIGEVHADLSVQTRKF